MTASIVIKSYKLKFWFDMTGRTPFLKCKEIGVNDGQGIISFEYEENTRGNYSLYKWFDEGEFPEFFDTAEDTPAGYNHRLKITGVDEL